MKARLMEEVKRAFKPEFINRVDDIIVFQRLTRENLEHILDIEIAGFSKRLEDKGIEIVLDPKAKDFLITKGFDNAYGARPLKRTIQKYLEDPIAQELISKKIRANDVIHVSVKDEDHLLFEQGTGVRQ